MVQNRDIELEVILVLLKNNSHIREIARIINEPHSSVLRKIRELERENILDFKEEGRNKVYFLKKTLEAKSHVFKAEHYKLMKILAKYPQLREIIEKIQGNNKIRIALLFGSYAKGLAKEDSDIDLYLDTTNLKLKEEIRNLNSLISVKIGSYNKSSLLIKEIEKNHVVIKGLEEYYEKNKFFD